MESIQIQGSLRTEISKKTTKAIRRGGNVPCVAYGRDGNVHFSTSKSSFKQLVYTPEFRLAEVNVEGKVYNCILKEVQFHPISDEIIHADFIHLNDDVPVNVSIPISFEGTSIGQKNGGSLLTSLRKVNIRALPKNLVERMRVDISHLALGQSVRVSDLIPEEGVEVTNVSNIPVGIIEVPRALKSAAAEEEAEAAAE